MLNIFFHTIWKKSLEVSIFSLLGLIVVYLTNTLLGRMLPTGIYGDYYITVTIISYCAPIVLAGADTLITDLLPFYAKKSPDILAPFLAWNFKFVTRSILLFLLIYSSSLLVLIILSGYSFDILNNYHISIKYLWIVAFAAIITHQSALLRAQEYFLLSKIGYTLWQLLFLLMLSLIYFAKYKISIDFVLISLSVAMLLSSAYYFAVDGTFFKKIFSSSNIGMPLDLKEQWFKKGISFSVINLVMNLSSIIAIIELKILGQHAEHTDFYAATMIIGTSLSPFMMNIHNLFAPILKELSGNKHHIQKLINSCNLVKLIISGVITGLLIIFGKLALSLFGPRYVLAENGLYAFLFLNFLAIQFSLARPILLYSKAKRFLIGNAILRVILTSLFGLWFIPKYYYMGAIYATVLPILLNNLISAIVVRYRLGYKLLYIV